MFHAAVEARGFGALRINLTGQKPQREVAT